MFVLVPLFMHYKLFFRFGFLKHARKNLQKDVVKPEKELRLEKGAALARRFG
jgi:hypothetical protein